MKTLVFVTQNRNKLEDAKRLMPGFEIEHVDFEVPEIQSLNSKDIIEHKLKFAYVQIKRPCFVMDTGLYIDVLNGFPGPLIKWFYHQVGADKISQVVQSLGQTECKWTTTLGYFDGKEETFLEETVMGDIAPKPQGDKGYEWDVIFIPKGEERTLAEMTFEEKQTYAVTKKLLGRFQDQLNDNQ